MSKHTPGPWSSKGRENQVSVPLKSIDCERIGFAVCFVNGHREEEAKANARLIAAAPELLEALRLTLGYADLCDMPAAMEACQKARAAIAKATGGA